MYRDNIPLHHAWLANQRAAIVRWACPQVTCGGSRSGRNAGLARPRRRCQRWSQSVVAAHCLCLAPGDWLPAGPRGRARSFCMSQLSANTCLHNPCFIVACRGFQSESLQQCWRVGCPACDALRLCLDRSWASESESPWQSSV